MSKLPSRSVNEVARSEVLAMLERRGVQKLRQARDLNRRVLVGESADGRSLTFVVKAKTSGTWQASINDGDPDKARRNLFWIFVDLGARPSPDFFVMPDLWIRKDIERNHEEYLERHGGRRALGGDSTHHAIQPRRIEQWKDRWDLIGRPQ